MVRRCLPTYRRLVVAADGKGIPVRRGIDEERPAGCRRRKKGEKLIKIGPKVVRHSRQVTFQMAEAAVPRELFVAILDRIQRIGVPPPLVQRG